MTVPITNDIVSYQAFWTRVVIGCAIWGTAVIVLLILIWRK